MKRNERCNQVFLIDLYRNSLPNLQLFRDYWVRQWQSVILNSPSRAHICELVRLYICRDIFCKKVLGCIKGCPVCNLYLPNASIGVAVYGRLQTNKIFFARASTVWNLPRKRKVVKYSRGRINAAIFRDRFTQNYTVLILQVRDR